MNKPRDHFIIVTGDHGGYKEGYCFLCGKAGWIEQIEHSPTCYLADPDMVSVVMEPVIDPERICVRCKGHGQVALVEQDSREPVTCNVCDGTGRRPKALPSIDLRWYDGKHWWRGPSGEEYRIEQMDHSVRMQNEAGNVLRSHTDMKSLLTFLQLHLEEF